jgi:PKD repeat protein
VTLTVTDDESAIDSAGTTADIGVGNQPPVADPNGPYTGTAGTPVTFDGSGSSDPDGTIASYDWDFGDGVTGTGVSPTHTYATDGVFTVTLTVTDNEGAPSDPATTTANIGAVNQPPVADPNGPYTGVVGVAVMFDGTGSSDPDGTIVSYDWDFGDGSTGTGPQPQHAYAAPGVYDVTLTVTDDTGDTSAPATTTATIDPVNQAPTADPNGPYTGTVGVPVTFDGSGSSDPDGTIVSYDWDFGDGNTGTGVSPTYIYATDGAFTVTLTVTDNEGSPSAPSTTTATIGLGNQPPVADPNGPYTGTVGVPVAFDGTGSSDPDGTIVSYDWDFGDGTVVLDAGPTPTHTYAAAGLYNVTLTVTDDAGATDSAMTTATINPAGLIEAEVDAPGAINAASQGRTPIEIGFDDGMPVMIAELTCGGDISNAMAEAERINVEDDEENQFTALFRTPDLMLDCEDTEIVCTGTLADGRSFEGMNEIRVIRDVEGKRCK